MVDVQLIKDTIKELLEANVDKDTIFSTLKDIGVEEGEIKKYYTEMTSNNNDNNDNDNNDSNNENNKEEEKEEKNKDTESLEKENKKAKSESIFDQEGLESPKVDKIVEDSDEIHKKVVEDKHQEDLIKNADEIDQINTNDDLEENKKKETIEKINNSKKIKDTSLDNEDLSKQLTNLQEQIVEIKAQINGLTKIMKDILEENRNIINKL